VNCILDVGANVGSTAIEYSEQFPKAKVFAFEPVSQTFEVLKRNTQGRERIIPIQKALGDFIGVAKCAIHEDCRNNSLIGGLTDQLHSVTQGEQQVEVTTLDEIASEREIDFIDLLKIDAEGFDLAVLHGAKKSLELKKIKLIYFEFHHLLSQTSGAQLGDLATIANFLKGYGYRFITIYTDSVHGAEALGTYNALFLAKDSGDSWRY
jgi:FkbM family methyltransferase